MALRVVQRELHTAVDELVVLRTVLAAALRTGQEGELHIDRAAALHIVLVGVLAEELHIAHAEAVVLHTVLVAALRIGQAVELHTALAEARHIVQAAARRIVLVAADILVEDTLYALSACAHRNDTLRRQLRPPKKAHASCSHDRTYADMELVGLVGAQVGGNSLT
jgi:lysylphosphatidylglycerol synthetase-like protein (DUF2156 family)